MTEISMKKVRVHIVISGSVQGVLYRRGAQDTARELGLTGWARNASDGKVEIVAEGEKEKIEQFLSWCREGENRTAMNSSDSCL